MGAGKHPLELGLCDTGLQFVIQLSHFDKGIFIPGFTAEFNQNLHILQEAHEPVPAINCLLHGSTITQDLLSAVTVVPEAGFGNPRLQFLDILPFAIYVKETPEER
jgi:hypothetical protein